MVVLVVVAVVASVVVGGRPCGWCGEKGSRTAVRKGRPA